MSGFGFISSSWKANGTFGNYYANDVPPVSTYNSSTSFAGSDLAITCPQCGVYLINGTDVSGTNPIPIPCSFKDLNTISANAKDDGFIVYPNFGITVYTSDNYSGTSSTILYNAFTTPLFFSTSDKASFSNANLFVYDSTGLQWTNANTVNSIKVYYQGNEISMIPFS